MNSPGYVGPIPQQVVLQGFGPQVLFNNLGNPISLWEAVL